MDVENLTFKQQEQLIRYLFYQYESEKIYHQAKSFSIAEESARYQFMEVFPEIVELTLAYLSEDERRIIKNEFIEKKHHLWWLEYYSRSTFYRIKGKAMKKFINCLHNRKML